MGDINPPLPRLGFRFGEALNPGPGQHCEPHATTILAEFSVCALNPTAVLNKSRNILDIGANVYCLSETSATKFVQNEVDRQLAKPFRAHWGAAVEPEHNTRTLLVLDVALALELPFGHQRPLDRHGKRSQTGLPIRGGAMNVGFVLGTLTC